MKKTVYFIAGDGIGPEVFKAGRPVIDAAVAKAYNGEHSLVWEELLAGEKAYKETGNYLPQETLDTLQSAELAFKGPLATPIAGGFRSLNVTLRQTLDLFACIRPIRYFEGIESPVKRPDLVDMIVFRENTEDVYAGIEYASGTDEAKRLLEFLRDELGANVDVSAGVGVKPITEKGSKRLVRKAIEHAVSQGKPNVTLVHKGNIMKYTEGAFRNWGYEVAADEFADSVVTEADAKGETSKVIIKDRIADAMFQEVLMRPQEYSVIATTNLNGDYISDALAAQVGGLGLAPGVNMNQTLAFFEPTHGTAPTIAGMDKANPGSIILSGAMMLEHIGLNDAASLIHAAMDKAISGKKVTIDLVNQMEGATAVGCTEFGEILASYL
ncbi:NADP-dependent isocitrate dehydrogenase [Desulfovibrio inopinatus]|uniref:NADP-dependent isocitrate dehydrogenase n=1 Tax=Desulfovibrio inopinatus TaxID=102109 RepID=UPI000409E287|nr:NADP-dependent isocitrate dehydrogenase [Desulfovibrio inopinatus]